jgi:Raf kinase inhibitor-like YbhB/YbcL family protein
MQKQIIIAALVVISSSAFGQMKITSPAFQDGGKIPAKYTCDGANVNPALHIQGAPAAAKTLVLIVDDPDAPGGLFTHWLAWNIDPKMADIAESSVPPNAKQGKSSFGNASYGGPCPPSGTHRYFFRIFALDHAPDLAGGATRDKLNAAMKGHVIAQGELMGRYSKQK